VDLGLEGRVVLITDGTRSIGRATAERFAAEGARVAVTYPPAVPRADAEAAAREIGGPDGAMALPLDLVDPASIRAAVDAVRDAWGTIHTFVANAIQWGDGAPGAHPVFAETPPEVWRGFLDANLSGVLACLQAVLPAMPAAAGEEAPGHIVFLSSEAVRFGFPGSVFYAAAKAALQGVMTSLIAELEGAALVNIVAPGLVLTSSTLATATQEQLDARQAITPSRRLTTADDCARAVLFYGSPANPNVSGDTINLTGGR
jgi:3-oxoacyl-[acyl-carrier protein] reductase